MLPKHLFAAIRREQPSIRVAPIVVESAAWAPEDVHQRLGSRPTGLTADEAATRLVEHGPNVVAGDARKSISLFLWHAVVNPLVLLLAVLATISFATGDVRAGSVRNCA
jgi:Mg2+-importing ATPase